MCSCTYCSYGWPDDGALCPGLAVSLRVDDLVALDHGQGHAGNLHGIHLLCDEGVDAGEVRGCPCGEGEPQEHDCDK